jgi:hypothetical protein
MTPLEQIALDVLADKSRSYVRDAKTLAKAYLELIKEVEQLRAHQAPPIALDSDELDETG